MAEDYKTIRLSRHATEVADKLKDQGVFEDGISAARFAMSYAIKYYRDDLGTLEKLEDLEAHYDSDGNTYNVGTVDPDNFISNLMGLLYPGIQTPYRYVRVLMCYGLNLVGDLLDSNQFFPVSHLM